MTATQSTINSKQYFAVARQINKVLREYKGDGLNPEVKVVHRGTDGLLILLNDDAYALAEYRGRIQDLFHADGTFVVGDDDLYIEPFDSNMAFKVCR